MIRSPMRPLLALTASGLTAFLLAARPAFAEPASGWVDPPAKTGPVGQTAAPAAEPADTRAARGETAGPARSALSGNQDPAEPGRHRRAEHRQARHDDRRHGDGRQDRRRMAVSSEIDGTAPDPRLGARAEQAQRLAGTYLDSVSAPNAVMLDQAPRFYGDRVRFHGRSMSLGALIAEKRRFVRRWPERRYEPQDGTMRTACNAASATCVVRTVLGFRAENPVRRARSLGLSELTLTVSFAGERPVIVSESSRVLGRGSAALGSAERGRRDGA